VRRVGSSAATPPIPLAGSPSDLTF